MQQVRRLDRKVRESFKISENQPQINRAFFSFFLGHAFLLIWNNLFILEEAKAYLGWERIKDMLRNEEHKRLSVDLSSGDTSSADTTSLSKLKNEQFLHLRSNYKVYTPWVRFVFCLLTMLVTLWDIMLYFTLMHFHITLEKIIGASIAVLTWYFLYRVCNVLIIISI